jgi:hypothetical protein
LFGTVPVFAIYSHLVDDNSGINFSRQSIGSMNLPIVTILLGTRIFEGHQATLSISETRLTTNVKVYLEDNLIIMFTLLNTSDYVFITDTDLTGMRRFFLSLAESTLGTTNADTNGINLCTTTQPKLRYVKGWFRG